MKQNLLKVLVAFFVVAIMLPACNKAKKCSNSSADIQAAAEAYFNDDSDENCIAYKNALQVGIDKCNDITGSIYADTKADLPCN